MDFLVIKVKFQHSRTITQPGSAIPSNPVIFEYLCVELVRAYRHI